MRVGPTVAARRVPVIVGCNRAALLRSTALQASALIALVIPAAAQVLPPTARPMGGSVVSGAASIGRTANDTVISQSSEQSSINWQSFNVGSSQRVDFRQPNSQAVTLNTVLGPDPSAVAGRISANGQVVLINPSGVVFSKGSMVDAAGLVVATASPSRRDSIAGRLTLDVPGKPNAMVINQGTITIRQAGLAALVAPAVANSGLITARMGKVVLAGAASETVDLFGDGLMSLDVTKQVTQVPVGRDGKTVTALVTNSGTILAPGGTVQLTAEAVDGLVTTLVSAGGRIGADTTRGQTGTLVLNGIGGSLVIHGDMSAAGNAVHAKGGSIQAAATDGVAITPGATINASGGAGGGVVAIGTTLDRAKGGPSVTPTLVAKRVSIAKGATISASAIAAGNGGQVTVLSTDQTTMNGSIAARGGMFGGGGGNVEVSGGAGFALTGGVDVRARRGRAGRVLLDPHTRYPGHRQLRDGQP